jgi:N-acyl-D-amino-acid deacylase
MRFLPIVPILLIVLIMAGCNETSVAPPAAFDYDIILRQGQIYDGTGSAPRVADVGIRSDRIAQIGDLSAARGRTETDVTGLAVAPGFINMLSWADEPLLQDGRSLSDIRQGVTLEIFGEGSSMGPLNQEMKEKLVERQSDIRYDVVWTSLGEFLQHLEDRGVSTNVASFVGATTIRMHELGEEDRAATAEELARMQALVKHAMEEGAMGIGSSLVYAPANFASTEELVSLSRVVAEHGGMYVSHIRGEGDAVFEALEEFFTIVRESGARGEIYHLKVSGKQNWPKLDEVIRRIETARAEGLPVTADIYSYHASSTGLSIVMPPWVKEGGHREFVERLQDPKIRRRLPAEMDMIPAEDILLVSFRNPELRHLTGRTLAQVAAERGTTPEVTAMDLIIEDDSRIGTVRFTMSEENVRRKMALPWVAFCSDSGSMAPVVPFTNSQPHPRAYGSFARVLGKYVREEGILTLAEAVRRLTGFPAQNLKLDHRGLLAAGYYADVVVFDPATVTDRATFEKPHQLATGVLHVFINGEQVLADGEHTGATPGRFVKGPGWTGPR